MLQIYNDETTSESDPEHLAKAFQYDLCKEQEYKLRVVGELDFYEVLDAFIKGLENRQTYKACFWVFVLLQSGYYKHIWKHLAIHDGQRPKGGRWVLLYL